MIEILGSRIHVNVVGAGQPILFLHGNPDSSDLWSGVIDGLGSRFMCIAPDLPGFGRSIAADNFDYTLEGQARFVDALLSALRIADPINLVGHDFGGTFVAAWMAKNPDRVKRAAFTNTAFFSDYKWHFWAHVWRTPILGEVSNFLMNRLVLKMELRRGSKGLTDEHIDRVYSSLTPHTKRSVLRLYRSVRPGSLVGWEDLFMVAARKNPPLVLWGDGDPYIPDTFAERFEARRVVHFKGAGHWLPAIDPKGFSVELEQFVSERR